MSMVNLAGSRCFAKFRKNILILTKLRANAQRVVKSVVIPNQKCEVLDDRIPSPCIQTPAAANSAIVAAAAAMRWTYRGGGSSDSLLGGTVRGSSRGSSMHGQRQQRQVRGSSGPGSSGSGPQSH